MFPLTATRPNPKKAHDAKGGTSPSAQQLVASCPTKTSIPTSVCKKLNTGSVAVVCRTFDSYFWLLSVGLGKGRASTKLKHDKIKDHPDAKRASNIHAWFKKFKPAVWRGMMCCRDALTECSWPVLHHRLRVPPRGSGSEAEAPGLPTRSIIIWMCCDAA